MTCFFLRETGGNTTTKMTMPTEATTTTSTVPWNDPENRNLSFVRAVVAARCAAAATVFLHLNIYLLSGIIILFVAIGRTKTRGLI